VTYGTPGTLAAKQATTTVPIVMIVSGDALTTGLVASLARPGGNVTGSTFFDPGLSAKRIDLEGVAMSNSMHTGVIIAVIVYFAIFFWPLVKILHRMGFSGWWTLLFFTGPGFIVALWLVAYSRWPAIDNESPRSS
jgi:hypothetical protein